MDFVMARSLAFAAALACAAPALGADRADYVTLRTAELLNLKCAALKYVEHTYLHEAVITALDSTDESINLITGDMSREDYDAWKQGADDEAAQKAAEAGCTSAANSYLLTARAKASEDIFRAMLLAFHFNTLPGDDRNHVALPADQQASAERYDGFLQQVYGDSYPAFAEAQRQAAAASLPASAMPSAEPEEGALPTFGAIATIDDQDRILLAQSAAAKVLQRIEFEVTAETNGWLVKPLQTQTGAVVPALERADGSAPGILYPVWAGPVAYTSGGAEFRLALARAPEGVIRVMTYGAGATSLADASGVRFYVAGTAPYGDPGFRAGASVFEATPSSGPCLGGPCFDLPHDATVALLDGEGAIAELVMGSGDEPAGQVALRASELSRVPVR